LGGGERREEGVYAGLSMGDRYSWLFYKGKLETEIRNSKEKEGRERKGEGASSVFFCASNLLKFHERREEKRVRSAHKIEERVGCTI